MTATQQSIEPQTSGMQRFLHAVATLISFVFHPVFMSVVMLVFIYKLAPINFAGIKPQAFTRLMAVVALNTVLFPLLTVFLMKKLGFIESIHMQTSKDRIMPLIGIMIFYFWAYHVLNNLAGTPFIMKVLLLGSFWSVIVVFMISIFFKVSMHAAGAGGMLGILIVLMIVNPINMAVPLFAGLIIAGLIGTARLLLQAHKPAEIWLGYFVGILVQVAAYIYLV